MGFENQSQMCLRWLKLGFVATFAGLLWVFFPISSAGFKIRSAFYVLITPFRLEYLVKNWGLSSKKERAKFAFLKDFNENLHNALRVTSHNDVMKMET